MSRLTNAMLIVLLIITGVTLLLSCGKKTTEPSSSSNNLDDIIAQIYNTDWEVSAQKPFDEETGTTRMLVFYNGNFPDTLSIPIVALNINSIECTPNDQYGNHWEFLYPSYLVPGRTYEFALTVNGNTTRSSLEMAYHPVVVEPLAFDYTQNTLCKWTLIKNPTLQKFAYGFWPPSTRYEEFLVGSVRQFIIPAYTVPSTYEGFGFGVLVVNYNIVGRILFTSYTGDSKEFSQPDVIYQKLDEMTGKNNDTMIKFLGLTKWNDVSTPKNH